MGERSALIPDAPVWGKSPWRTLWGLHNRVANPLLIIGPNYS